MYRVRFLLSLAAVAALKVIAPAWAAQTINTTSTTSCVAQGGTVSGANLLTDFDNGRSGSGSVCGEPVAAHRS